MRMRVVVHAAVGLFVSLFSAEAFAGAPQKLPLDFDPGVAADPAGTQQEIKQAESGLPNLPVSELQKLTTSGVTLWYWPEMAAALARAGTSGPGAASWPSAPSMCGKHASFAMPGAASAACKSADDQMRAGLADLGACKD